MAAEGTRLESALRADGDLKLVAYMMAGHPSRRRSVEVGKRLAGSGIAALEIGIPYSDPLADGPVIQRAGQTALDHGMTVGSALEVAEKVAAEGTPVVLMTYVNPVLAHDPRRFAAEAAQAGVAGVIVPDLPVEESESIASWMRSAALDTSFNPSGTKPGTLSVKFRSHVIFSSRRCFWDRPALRLEVSISRPQLLFQSLLTTISLRPNAATWTPLCCPEWVDQTPPAA